MAVNIIANGVINGKYPFTVIDTDMTVSGYTAGINKLLELSSGSPLSTSSSISVSDSSVYGKITGIWKDFGGLSNSNLAFGGDYGFVLYVGDYSGTYSRLTFGGTPNPNAYATMAQPTLGALVFYINTSGSDISGTYRTVSYSTGVLFEFAYGVSIGSANNTAALYMDNSGICQFFHTNSANAILGVMPAGSTQAAKACEMSPLKIYQFQAAPSVARGVVKDITGTPVSNRYIVAMKRKTMVVVGTATSGTDGSYEMPLASLKGDILTFICYDDDAPPDVEAEVVDRVIVK